MNIDIPEADELDTGHHDLHSGYKKALYLAPAEETDDGRPEIRIHTGVGNVGTPMPAFHSRWAPVISYGPMVVGSSVVEFLESIADQLVELSEKYEGSEWDGSNHVGSWNETRDEMLSRTQEWNEAKSSHLEKYWDAGDYFGPAGEGWPELCEEADINPAVIFQGQHVEDVAEQIAERIEPHLDHEVRGTADYAERCAEEWIDEVAEDAIEYLDEDPIDPDALQYALDKLVELGIVEAAENNRGQSWLAEQVEVNDRTVRRWLSGDTELTGTSAIAVRTSIDDAFVAS